MPLWDRTQTVRFEQIDWEDETFRMSAFPDLQKLRESIEQVGVLVAPWLQVMEGGRYRVISGWRRLTVLRELGKDAAECCIFERPVDEKALFRAVLLENLAVRPLNLVEKAQIVRTLRGKFNLPDEKILHDFLPLLGFGREKRWLEILQQVPALPPEVQQALAEDLLSLDLLEKLPQWPAAVQLELTELFRSLRLGKNRQKELLRLLEDVARMRDTGLGEVLQLPEIRAARQDQRPASQRTAALFDALRRLRFPAYSQAEERFRRFVQQLRLPPGMQLQHSPYFESDAYTLQFRFRNQQEFHRAVEKLRLLDESGSFANLSAILYGE
ncbi:MAG TPA: hypothetical protein ENJ23_00400 [Bacteroidetes bacterium]|nr:hypothetical protein [Bacteroidota bacterium]